MRLVQSLARLPPTWKLTFLLSFVANGESTVPAPTQKPMWCRCNLHCRADSVNSTCRTDGYCFTTVEDEESGGHTIASGCLHFEGLDIQCRVRKHVDTPAQAGVQALTLYPLLGFRA
uniref:Activin types I and II receptor domain-containing protein n=1 Tax=Gopherus evgoodei TaxID=1825980 RepID=A0A8C5EX94_9SAUR